MVPLPEMPALLAELRVPLVLALNMHDEAAARGVTIDMAALAEELGVPVEATVATDGRGIGAYHAARPRTHTAVHRSDALCPPPRSHGDGAR